MRCMRPLIQFEREIEDQAVESRGQNENLHATLAKIQPKNIWEYIVFFGVAERA